MVRFVFFKRKHSRVWQVAFTLDGRQVRVSSKKRIVKDAVTVLSDKLDVPLVGTQFLWMTTQNPFKYFNGVVRQTWRFRGWSLFLVNDNMFCLQIFQDFTWNHPIGSDVLHTLSIEFLSGGRHLAWTRRRYLSRNSSVLGWTFWVKVRGRNP